MNSGRDQLPVPLPTVKHRHHGDEQRPVSHVRHRRIRKIARHLDGGYPLIVPGWPTPRAGVRCGMGDGLPPLEVFVGRAAELARVTEVITRVAAGQPWLVAIEGDPGVGKTTLMRYCLAGADGFRTLSARAAQAEADLGFVTGLKG
jgi:hypothetical protein